MTVAVRSPLIAGVALALSAGAITPAPVALASFDSPLGELLSTVNWVNNDLFNGFDTFGDYQWEPYQGALPEFIYTALPIVSQLGYNGAAYIGGTVSLLTTSVSIIDQAVWNLPAAVVTATQQAIGGDIPGAITTLTNATVVPLQEAASVAFTAVSEVVTPIISNAAAVIGVLPGILSGLATTVVGGVQAVITAAVNIVSQTVGALSTGDIQTAWNTVVDGLLGPVGADGTIESSLTGVIESVTLGPGLGPLGYPNGYAVPSLRMWAEQSQLQIANALGASYPVPAAAKRSARSAAAGVKAAAVKPGAVTAGMIASAAAKPAVRAAATEKRRRG